MKKQIVNKGPKEYKGKIRFDLIPVGPLRQIAMVLTYGAERYGANTYKKGIKFSSYVGATLRHFYAWWGGEKYDPESGLHHLAHAITDLIFLLHFDEIHEDMDDRESEYDYPFDCGLDYYDKNVAREQKLYKIEGKVK